MFSDKVRFRNNPKYSRLVNANNGYFPVKDVVALSKFLPKHHSSMNKRDKFIIKRASPDRRNIKTRLIVDNILNATRVMKQNKLEFVPSHFLHKSRSKQMSENQPLLDTASNNVKKSPKSKFLPAYYEKPAKYVKTNDLLKRSHYLDLMKQLYHERFQ